MNKKATFIRIFCFFGFLLLFFLLLLCLPDREYSEQENRYLQQLPSFSVRDLISGRFTDSFESYISDQFPFRDRWVTLKARCELLSLKKENNDIFYCGNDTLIERFTLPEDNVLSDNGESIKIFSENTEAEVYLALIPGAVAIESRLLPRFADTDDQLAAIDTAYAAAGVQTVNIASRLAIHSEEAIYYRTDHHWTTLGAYYGASALLDVLGLPVTELASYTPETVSDSFCGTLYSRSGFSWVTPDSIEVFVPEQEDVAVTRWDSSEPTTGELYDESYLAKKDQYSMFLGGNAPRVSVETGQSDKPKLLLIRDSYSDCLVPFLLDSFSRIDLLDMRYYKGSVSEYVRDNDIDIVIILMSIDTYCEDANLFLLES